MNTHNYQVGDYQTSDCLNGCGCWAGPFRSGGPKGIDPLGECPKAPKSEMPADQPLSLEEKIREALEEAHNHTFSSNGYGGECRFCLAIAALDSLVAETREKTLEEVEYLIPFHQHYARGIFENKTKDVKFVCVKNCPRCAFEQLKPKKDGGKDGA